MADKKRASRGLRVAVDELRRLRMLKGWSQGRLAKSTGCSKRTIENAEAGNPISLEMISYIAQALEVPLPQIIGVEEADLYKKLAPPQASAASTSVLSGAPDHLDTTRVELIIDADFKSFSEEQQAKILESIRQCLSISGNVHIIAKRRG
jgi:transcriptional regulator with XRE-family HTH domain